MRLTTGLLCLLVVFHCSYAPPVHPDSDKDKDSEVKDELEYNPEDIMEYHRYLQEVVQALESDPDFRERLEKANEEDVRSGKIAEQLDFVNHNVRTKLDEIKRRELERLRHLATKQYEINNNLDVHGKVPTNEHLDHGNPHTFEIEDLKKLILKTTKDLEAADKQRKQEFKEYEMQKEFEKQQKIEHLDEQQKKEYVEKLKQEEEAKKHHKPLHHPGSKPQLEEVWEKQDHMDQEFDPKAFFMMHDVDGNGVWDANEVKALFIKELDKLYGPGGPNKDLHERAEEMERMREHVFKENDKNRDGLIDFQEFMLEAKKASFNQDEGWKPLDENEIYTQAEYQQFEKQRLEEIKYLQMKGLLDANGNPIPGAEHQINQAIHEKRMYDHHQAMQQQYYQQGHPGQYPPGQVPQYQVPQGHPGQPQYQQHPGQFQAQHPGQFQGQQQFQQPPQQYHGQGQQQQQYQGQPQQYPGQVPQQQYQQPPPQQQHYQEQPQQQHPPQQFQGQQQQQQYQGQQQQYQGQQQQFQQPQGQQAPKTGQNLNQVLPAVQAAQPSQGQVQVEGQAEGQPPQNQPPQGQQPQNPPQALPPQGQPAQGQGRQTSNQPQGQKPPA